MSCSTNSRTRIELHCDLEGDFVGEDLDIMEMYACANQALGELGVSNSFYMISADVLGAGCGGISEADGNLGTPLGPDPEMGKNILESCFGKATTVTYESSNALPHYVVYKGTQCYLNSSPHCGEAKQYRSRAPWCDACSTGNTCPYETRTCTFNGGACPSSFMAGGGLDQTFPINADGTLAPINGDSTSAGVVNGPLFLLLMALLPISKILGI